jgi:predicted nucleic acid-binding protein
VSASEVLFDTWAWWEVLGDSLVGRRLAKRFLRPPGRTVHTSVLTLGELAAKMARQGDTKKIDLMELAVRSASRLHDVSAAIALRGGRLREELRRREPNASLADGIILATARTAGVRLVSADRAFRGLPDLQAV